MGKGRIITDHGEGLYTIELLEDRVRAEASRTLAVERITYLDDRIADLEVDLAAAQSQMDSAANTQNQAINAYQADPTDENRAVMTAAGESVIQAAAKRDAIAGNIRALKIERLALQRQIDRIDALPALRQQQAWCADLTESLSGEVGTAEVPGQAQQVLVHPGHDGAAVYDQARDGALQPALSGTPAGVFYNLAMLPAWQKWRPTYRIATITALDVGTDACAIDIEPATSTEQGLNVNAESSYAGVPVQYMTCNAGAFEVGDRVLVRFDRQDQSPTVIGFESSPRACLDLIIVRVPIEEIYTPDDGREGLSGNDSCPCTSFPSASFDYSLVGVKSVTYNLSHLGAGDRRSFLAYSIDALDQYANGMDLSGLEPYRIPATFVTWSAASVGSIPESAFAKGAFQSDCEEIDDVSSSLAPRPDVADGYYNFFLSGSPVGTVVETAPTYEVDVLDAIQVDCQFDESGVYGYYVLGTDQANCSWGSVRSIESSALSPKTLNDVATVSATTLPDIEREGNTYEPIGFIGSTVGFLDELTVTSSTIFGRYSLMAVYKRAPQQ